MSVALTSTQRRALGEIITLGERSRSKPVVLEGLFGTGKTTTLSSGPNTGSNFDSEYYDEEKLAQRLEHESGVISISRRRMLGLLDHDFSSDSTSSDSTLGGLISDPDAHSLVVLPAMTEEETAKYVKAQRINSPLELGDIIRYSLGIHFLAQNLLVARSGLRREDLALCAASYLFENKLDDAEMARRYIQMRISPDILERIKDVQRYGWHYRNDTGIYVDIGDILNRQHNTQKYGGIEQPSPFFIAPQSVDIYNKMIKVTNSRVREDRSEFGSPFMQIYVPHMSVEEVESLRTYVFTSKRVPKENLYGSYREGSRTNDMFPQANWIGPGFYLSDGKAAHIFHTFDKGIGGAKDRNRREYIRHIFRDERALERDKEHSAGEFYTSFANHYDFPVGVVKAGYMFESLFQQMGIPYAVNNCVIQKRYVFDPALGNIIDCGRNVSFCPWLDDNDNDNKVRLICEKKFNVSDDTSYTEMKDGTIVIHKNSWEK